MVCILFQVCIVEKRGTGKLYAMKYMNKSQCIERDALNNVLREVEILASLEHPFLVNLWFSFQDEEDLFMVSDLFMGGDLRYHIQQKVQFREDCVQLYVMELALALEYLRSKSIVHRDVKPDNILLDERGHAHLTDFNIATVLREGQLATSMSGTKPYMAPEIFACVTDECAGYNFAVDWWSLGICAFEMLALVRPYDIHSMTSICEVRSLFSAPLSYPRHWSSAMVDLLSRLICVEPGARISTLSELKTVPAVTKLDITQVLNKTVKPSFAPPKDHLNCDPTLELEEMIVETKPLHKKKKRLAKQKSLQPTMSLDLGNDIQTPEQCAKLTEFLTYNREQELKRRELERKEKQWEEELSKSMELSMLESKHPPAKADSVDEVIARRAESRQKGMKKSMSYANCACENRAGPGEKNCFDCACEKGFRDFDVEQKAEKCSNVVNR
ncbi:UNVERIFIED_CONTAM: hypothetical protein PYX00_004241 [Menopon gallinae]|uniref:Protein kinase domain-containing protein n=1 Tax=Menopon gallinae TaxID=328185 RepID=A0AAW2I4G2_9NEOP